jgi:hypothetical protein
MEIDASYTGSAKTYLFLVKQDKVELPAIL